MNIVGVLSGKRKCLLAIAIAFSTFGNAQLVTYPEGLNTGMPHNDDYTVKVREAGGEWKDVFEYEVQVDMDRVQSASMVQFDIGSPVEVMVKKNRHHSGCENPSVSNRYTTYGKPQCYLFYTH